MDNYQSYIHKSRYARYLDDKQRRENWEETVDRYVTEIVAPKINSTDEIRKAILNMEVMPSMRAMMTAGKAAQRDNTCIYNCSYLPIDDPRSFDEAMFILMCGTGVGFSVEKKYTSKLPEVPDEMLLSDTVISVEDSKEGWARALRLLVQCLYSGEVPRYDVSKVRPAGARLKTFGGRASGPEPLKELFDFFIKTFQGAVGRKLHTIECHDLLCMIGQVVVVGGVRRSAMISLSDLHDERMRTAKAGSWWETHPYRALANNSAVYEETPSVGEFMREWLSIYDSHSGERGIFNREASQLQAGKNGRRKDNVDFGTNPCSEIILRPYQFCNLTEVIVRGDDTEATLVDKVKIATILGTIQSTYTKFPYLRRIWQKNTEEERLLGVSLTGIFDNPHFTPALLKKLKQVAVDTNVIWADILGIPVSTAITCVKPSGTVSQLTDSASGCHPRHAPYYIRRVRGDIKDPLTQFLIEKGIPNEPCVVNPNTTVVFSYPMAAPKGAITRNDLTALEHLEYWMELQQNYCEHKPSVTISVRDPEWVEVGSYVWKNFSSITGVSFLPHSDHTYRQAPYEDCTEAEYKELLAKMPTVSFDEFIEVTDVTEGAQQLACVSGVCEI